MFPRDRRDVSFDLFFFYFLPLFPSNKNKNALFPFMEASQFLRDVRGPSLHDFIFLCCCPFVFFSFSLLFFSLPPKRLRVFRLSTLILRSSILLVGLISFPLCLVSITNENKTEARVGYVQSAQAERSLAQDYA